MTRNFTALMASTVLAAGLGGAAFAQSTEEALLDRTHKGEIAAHGGARRLPGDITEAFAAEIKGGKVKNVILLIGDGMGDSEITIARNVALGAGGAFKGLDALPVTGQYTHYALTKDGKPDYVTDSAASGTGAFVWQAAFSPKQTISTSSNTRPQLRFFIIESPPVPHGLS